MLASNTSPFFGLTSSTVSEYKFKLSVSATVPVGASSTGDPEYVTELSMPPVPSFRSTAGGCVTKFVEPIWFNGRNPKPGGETLLAEFRTKLGAMLFPSASAPTQSEAAQPSVSPERARYCAVKLPVTTREFGVVIFADGRTEGRLSKLMCP